jgi:hypothetical protein
MEPLKPETKRAPLNNQPQATFVEIEEYERLLAEQFNEDPNLPQSPEQTVDIRERQERITELHAKLFHPKSARMVSK